MPLLKKKTLDKAPIPEFLRDDEEVFLCQMTNEIFRDYEEFAERTILCNSMVWTCSLTGKMNLTYEEALASEKSAKKLLQDFPNELKVPMLFVANLTRRAAFCDMAEDIYMFIKDRFFLGETVEASFAMNKWKEYQVVQVIAPSGGEVQPKGNGETSTTIPASLYKYNLEHMSAEDADISEKLMADLTQIRRKKGVYSRDKSKLFLKQYVVQNSDGYFGINQSALVNLGVAGMSFSKIFDGPEPSFDKSKAKATLKKARQETLAKFLNKNNLIDNGDAKKAEKKEKKEKKKMLAVDLASKVKEWYQVKDDLCLEDQKEFPEPAPVKSKIPDRLLGDALCVMEFVSSFSSVLQSKKYLGTKGLTFQVMEKALFEQKVDGPLVDILIMFLETIFSFQEDEEKSYKFELDRFSKTALRYIEQKKEYGIRDAIKVATALSIWTKTHQGMTLKMFEVCPLTISEILRLHLLMSGARLQDSYGSRMRSLCRGGFDGGDDPAVFFRLQNTHILRALSIHSVVELPINDKLKLLNCLVNQLLTYKQIRDVINEKMDSVKDSRINIKQITSNEKKRQQEADEQSKLQKQGDLPDGSGVDAKENVEKKREQEAKEQSKLQKEGDLIDGSSVDAEKNVERSFKTTADEQIDKLKSSIFNNMIHIGCDRALRRYIKLSSVPGLFVNQEGPNIGGCESEPIVNVPELVNGDRRAVKQHIRKMHVEMNSSDKENDEKPDTVNGHGPLSKKTGINNNLYMCSGDPTACVVHPTLPQNMWKLYKDRDSLEDLISCLNTRGVRESDLLNNLKLGLEVFTEAVNKTPSYLISGEEKMEEESSEDIAPQDKKDNFGYSDEMSPSEILCSSAVECLLEFDKKLHSNLLGGFPSAVRDKFVALLEEKKFDELLEELEKIKSDDIENRVKEQNSDDVSEASETDNEEYKDPLDYMHINTIAEDSEHEIVLTQSTEQKKRISVLAKILVYLAHSIKPKCLYLPIGNTRKDKLAGKNSLMGNWEASLLHATNYSQIFMHHESLKSCVAWMRSNTCAVCMKKGYSRMMAVCKTCNTGMHTFCLKPKLRSVPAGDWFCRQCTEETKKELEAQAQKEAEAQVNIAFSYDPEESPKDCERCGELEFDEVVRCNHCPRVYHLECVVPPIRRVPRTYKCTKCIEQEEASRNSNLSEETHLDDWLRRSNRVREEAKNGLPLHNAALQEVLADVMKHEDAWPFITPVQKREVPDYYDVISHPMDFGTIKYKLNMGDYKFDEELMHDVQLVFENCNTYNSSEDEVFQCGVRLSKYVINRANEAKLKTTMLSGIDIISEEEDAEPKSKRKRTG